MFYIGKVHDREPWIFLSESQRLLTPTALSWALENKRGQNPKCSLVPKRRCPKLKIFLGRKRISTSIKTPQICFCCPAQPFETEVPFGRCGQVSQRGRFCPSCLFGMFDSVFLRIAENRFEPLTFGLSEKIAFCFSKHEIFQLVLVRGKNLRDHSSKSNRF